MTHSSSASLVRINKSMQKIPPLYAYNITTVVPIHRSSALKFASVINNF